MSMAAIYNGFGQYEQREAIDPSTGRSIPGTLEKGITITYAGVDFWLPYEKVTYIPNFTLREVDHEESSAPEGEEAALVYQTLHLSGGRIAEELLEPQIPHKNREKGIILVTSKNVLRDAPTVKAAAGFDIDGQRLFDDVFQIEPTKAEIDSAHALAYSYKKKVVQEYIQSKRERIAGGHGQLFPTGLLQTFMDELGVKDIDDISTRQGNDDAISRLADLLTQRQAAPAVAPDNTSRTPLDINTLDDATLAAIESLIATRKGGKVDISKLI